MAKPEKAKQKRLVAVKLDERSIEHGNADQEHERAVAIYDLVEENYFGLPGHLGGPYELIVALHDSKLALEVHEHKGPRLVTHILSLMPFRRILKDYFMICENYYTAIRTSTPAQIEAIDMGRRGLHDEAAQLLAERLKGKIDCDLDTARRIFTLVTTLRRKG